MDLKIFQCLFFILFLSFVVDKFPFAYSWLQTKFFVLIVGSSHIPLLSWKPLTIITSRNFIVIISPYGNSIWRLLILMPRTLIILFKAHDFAQHSHLSAMFLNIMIVLVIGMSDMLKLACLLVVLFLREFLVH